MSFNQNAISSSDVIMFSATKQHSTPENTYTIDHHRRQSYSKDAELSPPPRRHSHHAPVCKFDPEKWKSVRVSPMNMYRI